MSERDRKLPSTVSPATAAIHAGNTRETGDRAIATPIHQTTTFWFESLAEMAAQVRGENPLDLYTRYTHPNHRAVEAKIAAMEGARDGAAFSTGMAALVTVVLTFCRAGDSIVIFHDIYGGTYRLVTDVMPRFGVEGRIVPTGDYDRLAAAIDGTTRLVIAETPTNPLVQIVDLARVAEICRAAGVVSLVDNTFASPALQRPIDHGIKLVLHSGTKYLGGHGDVMAGLVAGPKALIAQVHDMHKVVGGVLDPHAAFLLERGMKSLGARMDRHCANAMALATALAAHPKVARVHYPGLPDHPGHAVAARQMRAFGGMLAFDVDGDFDAADRFSHALRIARVAVSFGATETLVCPPSLTSHLQLTPEDRASLGIHDGTLRVSVGLEDPSDLVADFSQALDAA